MYLMRPESLEPVREVLADLWPDALQRLKLAVESRPKTERDRQRKYPDFRSARRGLPLPVVTGGDPPHRRW